MGSRIQCFLIEQANLVCYDISVFDYSENSCVGGRCHSAMVTFPSVEFPADQEVPASPYSLHDESLPWPVRCECGKEFQQPRRSSGTHRYWRRADTGEHQWRIGLFGPGAMWFASWFHGGEIDGKLLYGMDWDNAFEPPLIIMTPGGEWNVDSRASNCSRKEDRTHRCWVRHGTPPQLTVDKNGDTCAAGGGSIQAGSYHGVLADGILVQV
jgi:hypothetical protein